MTVERSGPLTDLRVADAGTFLAGPFCATLLGEFGAEVVKIEEPGQGDSLRRIGDQYRGQSLWWLQESRNKLAITLNLHDSRGQALLKRLVAESDVLIENFRPGTMERWNLGYQELSAINPGLIMVRISAYGQTGPSAQKPGFGRIAQAFSGLTYLSGYPDRPPVIPGSVTLADYAAGLWAAFATLVAVQDRHKTGLGQEIDISLYESIFRLLDILPLTYDTLGIVRERNPLDAPHAAPHSHYPTGDGKWVAIAVTTDKIFSRLCRAMVRPELADDVRFRTNQDRIANRDDIDEIVRKFTSSLPMLEVAERLDKFEVPVSPIYSIADIFADQQYHARGSIIEVEDERVGKVHMQGIVPKLSRTPGSVRNLGRPMGADNRTVFTERLGVSEAEFAILQQAGVI